MGRSASAVSLHGSAFFLMVGVGLIVSLLPARMVALSGSFSDVGCLASFFALPFVLLQLPIGALADRFGTRVFLVFGYLFCCLSALAYGGAATPATLYLGRFLQGVGEVPVWALAPAALAMEWPSCRGKVMGTYNAAIHLGLTAGSLLGLLHVDGWCGGQGAFLVLGASAFLGGVLVGVFGPDRPGAGDDASRGLGLKSAGALMVHRECRGVFAGVVLYGCGYGVLLTVVPISLVAERVTGPQSVPLYFALFYVSIGLSQLIGGALSDKTGRVPTMSLGLMIASVCLPLALRLHGSGLLAVLALAGFGLGFFCVSAMAALSDSVPVSRRGAISGAFYLAWGGGFFVGPVIMGMSADCGRFDIGVTLFSLLLGGNGAFLAYPLVSGKAPCRSGTQPVEPSGCHGAGQLVETAFEGLDLIEVLGAEKGVGHGGSEPGDAEGDDELVPGELVDPVGEFV